MNEHLEEIYEASARSIEGLLSDTETHEATGELSPQTIIIGDYEIELAIAYKAVRQYKEEETEEINEGDKDE